MVLRSRVRSRRLEETFGAVPGEKEAEGASLEEVDSLINRAIPSVMTGGEGSVEKETEETETAAPQGDLQNQEETENTAAPAAEPMAHEETPAIERQPIPEEGTAAAETTIEEIPAAGEATIEETPNPSQPLPENAPLSAAVESGPEDTSATPKGDVSPSAAPDTNA